MPHLSEIEIYSKIEWVSATYEDNDRKYEVVFTRSFDNNSGFETRELVNIERDGISLDYELKFWKKVERLICAQDL